MSLTQEYQLSGTLRFLVCKIIMTLFEHQLLIYSLESRGGPRIGTGRRVPTAKGMMPYNVKNVGKFLKEIFVNLPSKNLCIFHFDSNYANHS